MAKLQEKKDTLLWRIDYYIKNVKGEISKEDQERFQQIRKQGYLKKEDKEFVDKIIKTIKHHYNGVKSKKLKIVEVLKGKLKGLDVYNSRKYLAALELYAYNLDKNEYIRSAELDAVRDIKFDSAGKLSSTEKTVIKTYLKELKAIEKSAKDKKKKMSHQKDGRGKKVGEYLESTVKYMGDMIEEILKNENKSNFDIDRFIEQRFRSVGISI